MIGAVTLLQGEEDAGVPIRAAKNGFQTIITVPLGKQLSEEINTAVSNALLSSGWKSIISNHVWEDTPNWVVGITY